MKKLTTLVLLASTLSCQSQNIQPMEPIIDNKFEVFDNNKYIELAEKNKKSQEHFDENGNYLQMIKANAGSATYFTSKNSYFTIFKEYYKSGRINKKGLKFNVWGGFNFGTWYEFDEQGKLIKEIDYDKPFKFTFEDLLKFCEKEKIRVDKGPILQSTGYHTKIRRGVKNEKPWWEIEHLKKPDLIETIKLDGISGEIFRHKPYDAYVFYFNLRLISREYSFNRT